jgi:hypothetical protein
METNPKKSKALIITIIILVVFLVAGYFLFIKKDKEGNGTTVFSRVFSSLVSSNNQKNNGEQNGVSETKVAQAGEDIKRGDKVFVSGTNSDNNPIVMKAGGLSSLKTNSIGFSNQDINMGEMGEITLTNNGLSNFWNSISGFIGGVLGGGSGGGNITTGGCTNGASNPPLCTLNTSSECLNGANNPPLCTNTGEIQPDLVAGEITPTNTEINIPTTISSTITNQGQASTGHSFLTVFKITNKPSGPGGSITPNNEPTTTTYFEVFPKAFAGDTVLKINDETETITEKSSAVSSITHSFNTVGLYYIQACADGETEDLSDSKNSSEKKGESVVGPSLELNSVAESNENNNCSPWTIVTVTEKGSKLSDLKAGRVTPLITTTNKPTAVSSTITNDGLGSTQKGFSVLFIISPTTNINVNTNTNIQEEKTTFKEKIINFFSKIISIPGAIASQNTELKTNLQALPGKKNTTASVSYTFKDIGTYQVKACADQTSSTSTGAILESNENNNCSPWTIVTVTNSLPTGGQFECNDGADNDSDGKIDNKDPNCHIDGDLTKEYVSTHDSELNSPEEMFECNDGADNDSDGKIDNKDPNCHIDGDLTKEYVSTHDSELNSPEGDGDENKCLLFEENPLVFTDAEKAKLAELLRRYYLIAPTLKTEDDIYMTYRELDSYENLIETVDELTNQCYTQTSLASYTGPKTRYGNPWYKSEERGSYIPTTISDEKPHCEAKPGTSGKWQINDTDTGTSCSFALTRLKCENEFDSEGLPTSGVQDNCQWIEKTSLKEYEAILNIW